MTKPITREAILQAIREAQNREPDRPANIIRAKELKEILGWGHIQVADWLRREMQAGRVEPVRWPYRTPHGVIRRIEQYRFLDLPE